MFGVPREEVTHLLPCAICSAPFDPATLPSRVYDPYQNFLLFSQHASICPSCFAEELAKRTRPDPSTFIELDDFATSRGLGGSSERAGTSLTSSMRSGSTFHRKSSSLATIHNNPFPEIAAADSVYRRTNSSTNFRSGSALKRDTRSQDVLRRKDSLRESGTSYETYRHRPSTSIGYSTTSQKTSPELPNRSRRTSPEIPQRVASRNHSRAQNSQSSPDLRRLSDKSAGASLSAEASRKSAENVRRKVSFHKGGPVAKSFNPQSPPYHAVTRPADLPGPDVSGVSNLESSDAARQPVNEVPTPTTASARLSRWSSLFGVRHPHSVVQESVPSSWLSWSSWRLRRRQERETREHRWQSRKEQQRLKKLREDRERGIGLDLFCPHCQHVVTTTPKWRDGSCCMMYSACFFACTGPLCLCLLLPCAARQVLDVDGRCPSCETTLSTWNRRKNQLTILTWAGVRESTVVQTAPYLAPRPHPEPRLERAASARLPPSTAASYVHYSRPRTAMTAPLPSRTRTSTSSSSTAPPSQPATFAPPTSSSIITTAVSRPRTMSSAQHTVTASTATARTSGGSPPTTTRSSPSSRMAASSTTTSGTTAASSQRTGSSSHRTVASVAGSGGAASVSTGVTLVNTGAVAMVAPILYEEDDAAGGAGLAAYEHTDEHDDDDDEDEEDDDDDEQLDADEEQDIVATDFAAFLQDPVGQGYLHDNHAITHAALGHAVQIIVPQQLLDEIELDEVGRAIG